MEYAKAAGPTREEAYEACRTALASDIRDLSDLVISDLGRDVLNPVIAQQNK